MILGVLTGAAGRIRIGPLVALTLRLVSPGLIFFLTLEALWDRAQIAIHDSVETDVFDFIVVGAGVSGSVVANRLSVNHRVLLLETGGFPHGILSIPILAFVSHGREAIDWSYKTVPQTHSSKGLINNQTSWSSGKAFGGSSVINGMIYIRGTVQGFDTLSELLDDPEWSLENVLKYYVKEEDYKGHFAQGGEHGNGVNLKVGKSHQQPFVQNWLEAGAELGYPTRDPNSYGKLTEGFAPMDYYMEGGERYTAFDGYIRPILSRKNLVIRKFAYVHKVLLDDANRAYGVQYTQHGGLKVARASKEVILSAGAIQSAKILMLSGIGPRDHLEEIGIPIRVDLPVGQNLMDKYGAIVGPFTIAEGTSFLRERDLNLGAVANYVLWRQGPMSSSTAEGTCAIKSPRALARGDSMPDIDIYLLASSMDNQIEVDFRRSFNYRPEILEYFAKSRGIDGFQQFVTLPKPKGTGNIRLKDSDPYSMPLIDPKYLQNEEDVATLVEGIKFAIKLVEETEAFRKINGSLPDFHLPGCEGHIFKSDAYFECLARSTTLTAYKYCSTAPIGKDPTDPVAVVDPKLRVFGTKGLRVIDGSVLREKFVSVNAVTCIMLSELASDFILRDWKDPGQGGMSPMVGVNETLFQEVVDEALNSCVEVPSNPPESVLMSWVKSVAHPNVKL